MPYVQRKRRGYSVWLKVRWWVIGLVGGVVLGGGFWGLTKIGPRKLDEDAQIVLVRKDDPALVALQQEVESLTERYEAAGEGADPEPLREAVELQQEVVAKFEGGGQSEISRLLKLEQLLDAVQAREINALIKDLDTTGRVAYDVKKLEEADLAWTDALEKQRAVNRSGAPASLKNFRRESELEQKIQGLAAAPLAEEMQEALAVARREVAAENWAEAYSAFGAAREAQQEINTEFARSRYADRLKLDRIDRELESLDAANLAAEVDELEASGDAAMAAEDYTGAAIIFEQARQLQTQINRDFTRSQFLSSAKVQSLEVKRQTAASVPLIEEIKAENRAIEGLLRQRQTVLAGERIVAAEARLRAGYERLKRGERWDPELQLRLGYLASQAERLAEIQDAIYERLRPLPGVGELRVLRTEFPQALYQQVMKTNPSRNPGRAFPVDSVNWFEATNCCERLSWIMGRAVRLPTGDEFRIAVAATTVGEAVGDRKESQAMASAAPNAAGLFDLRGNLAEWLAAPAGQAGGVPAPIAGGSYLNSASALQSVIRNEMPRSGRARHVGFRIVVEFDSVD